MTSAQSACVYYYTSGDLDGTTWSVYREQYATADDSDPIDGSQERVSTHATEDEASAEARRLQILESHRVNP